MAASDRVLDVLRKCREAEISAVTVAVDEKYQILAREILDALREGAPQKPSLLTLQQAGAALGISDRSLRRLRKKYPQVTIDRFGRRFIDAELLRRLSAAQESGAPVLSAQSPNSPEDKSAGS